MSECVSNIPPPPPPRMLKLVQEGTVYIISWNRKHSAEITVIIMNVKGKFREKYINLYNIVLSGLDKTICDVIKQNQKSEILILR